MKISPKKYAQLIYEVANSSELREEDLKNTMKKIVGLVKSNRDEKKLTKIIAEFERIYLKNEGVIEGEIISSREISGDKLSEIKKRLAEKYSVSEEKVQLKGSIQKDIKGGFILKVEDEILDASLRGKIKKLRSRIA